MYGFYDRKTARVGTKIDKSPIALFCTFQLRGVFVSIYVTNTYENPKHFFMKDINLRDGSEATVSIPDKKSIFESQCNRFRKEAQRLRGLWRNGIQTYRCVCGQFRVKSGVKDYREIGRDLQGYSQENVPFKKDSVEWTNSRRKTNELSW